MRTPSLPQRKAPHTHWLKVHFRSLKDQQILLIQSHFVLGDSARAIAKQLGVSVGTVYKAKNSVPSEFIAVSENAFSAVLERLRNSLKRRGKTRLRAVPKPAKKKGKSKRKRNSRRIAS